MKQTNIVTGACAFLTIAGSPYALAQGKTKPTAPVGRNLTTISFSQKWTYQLDDAAKLMDIGPITDPKKNNLLTVLPGKDATDNSRKLVVLHWDGKTFSKDISIDFHGLPIDSLIIGKFRSARNTPVQRSPFDRTLPGSRPGGPVAPIGPPPSSSGGIIKTNLPVPPTQVVTTDGIYAWMNKGLNKLFTSPLDVRLAMVHGDDDSDDKIVTGSGDATQEYEVGENYVRESSDGPPLTGGGFVRFGSGMQDFPGAITMNLAPDVRYVQSSWEGKAHWMIGVVKGKPAKLASDKPTGDRLVVFVPHWISRNKSFWQMKMDDFEEDWRSDPLPGRIMDVRIGDPHNDGKEGIIVLTSENKDTEGHLYFYLQDKN